MKAVLSTRCGCQQTFVVSWPPPPVIVLPLGLSGMFATYATASDEVAVCMVPPSPTSALETRRFELDGNPKSPQEKAYYAEVS